MQEASVDPKGNGTEYTYCTNEAVHEVLRVGRDRLKTSSKDCVMRTQGSQEDPDAQGARNERTGLTAERRSVERQRIQLDFSQEAYERLGHIREMAEARTNAEVVRNALRLYEWFLEQRKNECRIQLVKGDTVREIELLL